MNRQSALRVSARTLVSCLALALAFAAADAPAEDDAELQRQIEAQNELIRRQTEALEQQSREMERMGDRVRVLEDERRAAQRMAPAVGAAPAPGDPSEHVPGSGFPLAKTQWGSLNARLYSYARYLNQKGIDEAYTDSFGVRRDVDDRQDIQLNKVTLYTYGWMLDPKFRYLFYVWSANTSQGLSAQVVVAGHLDYEINEHLSIGAGINSLPGTRSTSGSFPFWLGVDNRLIADEFFRPSYTTGIYASGKIIDGLTYQVMLGNNLSQLGVDAGQLDAGLNTVSAELAWTTGDYGRAFGDFEHHEQLATRLGLHFTRSDEDAQSQPNTNDFDNVQIRLSDGSVIFQPGLFGPATQVRDLTYQMVALDGGLKYKGLSLEGEYFYRLLNNLSGPGTNGLGDFNDHGFQLQASGMLIPRKLQLYASGSKIFGEYGDPWDARLGVNWYPFENQGIRWNNEVLYVHDSPVGALSLPYLVGANGVIFYSSFEVFF